MTARLVSDSTTLDMVAGKAMRLLLTESPHVLEYYDSKGLRACLDDLVQHVRSLRVAADFDAPELAADYGRRCARRFAASPLRLDSLIAGLRAAGTALADVLPRAPVTAVLEAAVAGAGAPPPEIPSMLPSEEPYASIARDYLGALLDWDRRRALRAILDPADRCEIALEEVYGRVLAPVQYEIGSRWQSGRLSVAAEHYCSRVADLVMAALFSKISPTPHDCPRAVIACVAGEHHELGARIVADVLEIHGWCARFVGADTPSEELAALAAEDNAALVGLSVTMLSNLSAAVEAVRAIRESTPTAAVVVGGHPFVVAPHVVQHVGADASVPLGGLVEIAERFRP